jgi:hypothetical protein
MSAAEKNLSEESSSRTYQKYCAIGITNEPTIRTANSAVYLPVEQLFLRVSLEKEDIFNVPNTEP